MFDLFVNRSVSLMALDVNVAYAGDQTIWIYATSSNSSNTQCKTGCSYRDASINTNAWVLISSLQVHVNSSLRITVPLTKELHLLAGETRGFLYFAGGNASLSGVAFGDYSYNLCPLGVGIKCSEFSDSFLTIEPAALLLGVETGDPNQPLIFQETLGDAWRPLFFAGAVHYVNDEVTGDSYFCRFMALDGSYHEDSPPTRIFAQSSLHIPSAQNLTCVTPSWPHPEQLTLLSLVSNSSGEVAYFYDTTSGLRQNLTFDMKASIQAMLGATIGVSIGGGTITIRGYGFSQIPYSYQCKFSGSNHIEYSNAVVVLSSY